jgi:hypothetical protein
MLSNYKVLYYFTGILNLRNVQASNFHKVRHLTNVWIVKKHDLRHNLIKLAQGSLNWRSSCAHSKETPDSITVEEFLCLLSHSVELVI